MTRLLFRRLSAALLMLALAIASASRPAHAQAPYDPPTLSVVKATPSYVAVRVTAGASGTPNGFYVEWMYKSVFDALGGWPEDPYDPSLYYCNFDGMPSWHVGGSYGYKLGPGESIDIVLGELNDETGVSTDYVNELTKSQGVIIHGYTEGDASRADSPLTPDLVSATTAGNNCTFTVGWWKNHYPAWPGTGQTLGTRFYTNAELQAILQKPAGGNGLILLAHQLIATLLNIAQGADASSISATIADAQSLIDSHIVPPTSGYTSADFLDPSVTNADTAILDDFNNGVIGPGHCGSTPAHHASWGQLKTLYR